MTMCHVKGVSCVDETSKNKWADSAVPLSLYWLIILAFWPPLTLISFEDTACSCFQ